MDNQEKIKDTIKALLNLARNDAAADGEIENAMRFASKLMNEHNLSEEDLGSADEKIDDVSTKDCGTAVSYSEGARKNWWEIHLGMFVCDFIGGIRFYHNSGVIKRTNHGTVVQGRNGAKTATRLTFYGISEDAGLAKTLYDEMVVTVAAMGRLRYGGAFRGAGRNYCEGFVDGLFQRLEEVRDQERQIAQSQKHLGISRNALILVSKRNSLVKAKKQVAKDYLEEKGITLQYRAMSNNGRQDRDAIRDGFADGKRAKVSVNRTRRIEQ